MNRLRKLILFYKKFGFKALLIRLYAEIQRLRPDPNRPETIEEDHNINNIIDIRFITLNSLKGFSTTALHGKRINLVTDSINSGSLFGGVATSFILSTLLARHWNCGLRIITRTESPQKSNYFQVLSPNGIPLPQKVEFEFSYFLNPKSEISIGPEDIFITTSWWTTSSVRKSINSSKIFYLIQEDERAFYPYGDDHLLCSELMSDPNLNFIVNTKMLYNHLISEGFQNIGNKGVWFEPAWPDNVFYLEKNIDKDRKNFFFYARPNNIRNLFYRGLEVIEGAATRGIINPNDWEFHFVGKDIPEIRILGKKIKTYQGLIWSDYAALIRRMDLGLSLMYTPHPSYPPIDLAASGAVVVTNKFGLKKDLHKYSKNIFCCDLNTESLINGLERGVALTLDWDTRLHNYQSQQISRSWEKSFQTILENIDIRQFNV